MSVTGQETARREVARRALTDVAFFARALVGRELWSHQLEVAVSPARYRVVCAGRQVGKSVLLALLALWHAYRKPGQLVLIVSAGETASKRLLADVAAMATASDVLRGAVVDENASVVTLSNGSSIRSVPASQAQIRGWAVDLLIVDESGFIDAEIWRAAEPAIIARPGSRVILCSSPWGAPDHFFRRLWHRGMDSPDEQVEAWHWPSTVSPLVDDALLEEIRARETPLYFAREFLAQWTDQSGAFFAPADLDANVAPFEMLTGARSRGRLAVAGVDWGSVHDANSVVVVGVLQGARSKLAEGPVFAVLFAEERYGCGLNEWAVRVADLGSPDHDGFDFYRVAAEANGVGTGPCETLQAEQRRRGLPRSARPVWTDNRHKQSAYGVLKLLLQQGRLVLPVCPPLLRQLAALEFHQSDAGNVRIAVPDSAGHDDLADALMQAAGCLRHYGVPHPDDIGSGWAERAGGDGEELVTANGVVLRERPAVAGYRRAFQTARGADTHEVGW